jgi:hypothetical protein
MITTPSSTWPPNSISVEPRLETWAKPIRFAASIAADSRSFGASASSVWWAAR